MALRLAAILFFVILISTEFRSAYAQTGTPRRYPELLELMTDDASAASPSLLPAAAPQQVVTYQLNQPDPPVRATPASAAAPSQGSRPVIPESRLPATWTKTVTSLPAPRSSEIVQAGYHASAEPVSQMTPVRYIVQSAEQTIEVRESTPTEPLVVETEGAPLGLDVSAYDLPPEPLTFRNDAAPAMFTSAPPPPEENFIAPPLTAQNNLTPIPQEIPPAPSEAYPQISSAPPQEDFSPIYGGPDISHGIQGVDYDFEYTDGAVVEDNRVYRNLFPIDMFQEPDPCGEFVPFGNLEFKPGNDRVISRGGFMIPLWQSLDTLVFTDLRGSVDDHDSGDGYFGLGYRTYMDPSWIFGGYIYGDLIATNQGNLFGQGQLGFELMSLDWDIRVNGYAPGSATHSAKTESGISNGTAITRNFRERAYAGFDFEIGRRFLNWGWNDRYEVRGFLGGYGFGNDSNVFPSFGGPRGRVEMRIYDLPWCGQQSRLEYGVEMSYDRVRNEQIFGYLRVRIPLGAKQGRPALDPLRRRMVDTPIHRVD